MGTQRLVAIAAASLVAAAPVVTWTAVPAPAASARAATPKATNGPAPIPDLCPTTATGSGPNASGRLNGSETPAPSGAYYGNPKLDVVVAPTAPGLCPSFLDTGADQTDQLADLAGFVVTAEPVLPPAETPAPSCTTEPTSLSSIVAATDGSCQMDPDGTNGFPMADSPASFQFAVASAPLGWAPDPDDPPGFTAQVGACGPAGPDVCATAAFPFSVYLFDDNADVFSYIGIFRHLNVTVTSGLTGGRLAGVTVHLSCAVPAGQPSDVCPPPATARSDAQGIATFGGLYAPGAPLTITETGLPAPYKSATLDTTAPSPVTAATTTGAEINAATDITADLTVSPTAPLATVTRRLVEGTSIRLPGLGAATPGLPGLTVTSVGRAGHGSAALHDDVVTYTPTRKFVGADTFTYSAADVGAPGGTTATGHVDLTVTPAPPAPPPPPAPPAPPARSKPWYHDPISAAGRQSELAVPADPAAYSGPERVTRAAMRTRGGSFAVPLGWAFGHTVIAREALALTGASLFAFNSPTLTPHARAQLRQLETSLRGVDAITCQGFADYGNVASHEQALSLERAKAVCAVLHRSRPGMALTSIGYGGADPVVVGGGPSPLNRRVIIVVTKSTAR